MVSWSSRDMRPLSIPRSLASWFTICSWSTMFVSIRSRLERLSLPMRADWPWVLSKATL